MLEGLYGISCTYYMTNQMSIKCQSKCRQWISPICGEMRPGYQTTTANWVIVVYTPVFHSRSLDSFNLNVIIQNSVWHSFDNSIIVWVSNGKRHELKKASWHDLSYLSSYMKFDVSTHRPRIIISHPRFILDASIVSSIREPSHIYIFESINGI